MVVACVRCAAVWWALLGGGFTFGRDLEGEAILAWKAELSHDYEGALLWVAPLEGEVMIKLPPAPAPRRKWFGGAYARADWASELPTTRLGGLVGR